MRAYASDHDLPLDDSEDPIPISVFKKHRIQDVISFVWFCFSDAFHNNPYKLHVAIFLGMALCLIWCIALKWYIVAQEARRLMTQPWAHDEKDLRASLDTLASIFPVVVTLVLFLFPPLIANT